jgi:hypothetical protein
MQAADYSSVRYRGRLMQCLGEHRLNQPIADRARRSRARLIQQPTHALGNEALSPFADCLLRDTDAPRHLTIGAAVTALQNDARSQRE